MGGFWIHDCVNLLYQTNPDDKNVQKLYKYCFSFTKRKWSADDRIEIINLIRECLTTKCMTNNVAELFSPILLELLHRIQNHSKLSLFFILSRLIGLFEIVTNFSYDCFNNHLFNVDNLLCEIREQDKNNNDNEDLLIEFFESCLIFLTFDSNYFFKNFQWSFVSNFFNHSNQYVKYLAKRIHSRILNSFEHNDDDDNNLVDYRLRLYELTKVRLLRFSSKTIEYRNTNNGDFLICDHDLSENIVCVQGILLQVVRRTSISFENNEKYPVSSVILHQYLMSIALGVSLNKPILIEGPISSGKSTLIKYLALLTGRLEPPDIMSIQISDQIDTKYLLGSYITSEIPGEFVFNFGPLLKAIRDGNWIIFEDIDSASSELISSLVSIIESRNNGNIIGYEDKIDRFNSNFRIFFTKTLQKSDSIQSVNFTMLEKICYKVCLENFTKNQITDLIQKKWPNLNILLPKILEVYENLMNFQSETKPKRLIWLRDLLKWCNRLSKYFMKIQSEETSKFAYLDAMDCFTMFSSNHLKQQISYTIGSCFNLSKNDCEHLIQQRNPKIIKNINQITIGRQSIEIDSKFSQNISDFAFTLSTTQLLERLLVGIANQEPILLCGETGVGKTSTIQYLSNICGHRLNIINMNQQSSSLELFGGYKPVDFNSMIISIKEEYCKLFDQTFETKKNSAFKEKFDKLYFKQNWNLIIEIMINVCMKAFNKIEKENRNEELLFEKWTKVQEKLKKLKSIMENGKKNQLTFTFIDGILTNAINNGEWILLDEINLAENETLQGLLSFLENDQTLMLFEKSTNQMIKVHKNFRLFACMNPATDVGKKELPIKIRNRFTEFFIDECDDRSQLRIIVCTYIQSMVDPKTIESIVEFYFQLKYDSKTLLKDMNGHRPIFSLRNLCRALQVIKFNPFQSINRSIYEAFSLAFLSNLDQQSYSVVQKMIERIIFQNKNLKFSESIKNMEKLFPLKNFVIIENYPIIKGPNEPFKDDNYILTATVSKNLRDVCRIISAGRSYPILLQGETSVGKTSLIQWLAQATGNICHRVNNHEHTDLQEYIGSYCSQPDGKIIFKNGILIEAMKNGHWIILDELNLAPTEVLEALNRVLDENRECFIAETQELIKAHSRFLLFATQNPPGKYAGRKVLSRAFRNRFIELNFNEIPIDELEIILHKKCMIPLSYSKRMVSVLTQLQKCRCKSDIFAGKHGFITLRDLFRWGYRYMKFSAKLDEKIRFFDWNQFLANQGFMLLAGRVRQKDDVILIEEILEKIFKCKISQEELFYSNEKKFESKIDIFSNTLVWTNAFKRLGTLIKEAIEFEEPILLVGETGCGKTTICQYFSSINQKTLKIINCHMNTESSDFLGSLRPNRNACLEQNEMLFEWIDGPLVMAMKNGDYFLVDEISLADDSVLERLNSVLELERTIFLAENNDTFGRIKANKTFRYFATMNPGGDFGKKELSPALRDRFTEIWCLGFENLDDIYQIAFHNLEIFDEEIRKQISDGIRNFIEWFEQQIVQKHFIISVRDILSWTKFIDKTYSIKPQKLCLYDSFIHGAYLVYIDPFIIGNHQSLLANKIDEIKIKCQKYLENLCEKFRNIHSESEESNDSLFSDKDQISIGPFSLPKLNQQKNSPENYYWQSIGVHNNCIRLMRALQLDKPILLEGSPGVGKTSLIQALSSICCDSLIRINLSDQTDISDLFGCDLPVEGEGNAGKFEFRDGPFLTALKSQKSTWILLDELNLATQTVLEGLNACLDHRSEIFISELNKTFSVNKKQTRIFATQNPYSMDRSRKRLPKSFLNRFTIVYIEDLTDNDYYFILKNMFPKISTNIIQRMISVNRKICEQIQNFSKKGSPFEFNLRDLIRWIQLFDKFQGKYSNIEPELFFNQIYTNKMRTIECKQKIQQICQEEFVNFKYQHQQTTSTTMTYLNNSLFQMGLIISSRLVNNIDNRNIHYCFHQQFSIIESILICIEMNWLSILIGDSGIGKSHLIQLISNICGQHLNIIHANSEMDTIDLLGGFEQKDFNVDIKNLENEIVRYGFGEIAKPNHHRLWSKFWSYIYRLSTNNLSKFKLKTMKKVLNLFEDPKISSEFRNRLEKLEMKIIENHNSQDNGTFEWKDSSLVKSIQNGEWVVIENANLLNPAVLDRFNSLLEPDGCLTINEKGSIDGRITEIRPHQNFRLFFTMNPKYGELSRAMRNRGIEIVMLNENEDYSSIEEYRKILQEYGIPDQQEIEQMNRRQFFQSIEQKILKNQQIGSTTNQPNNVNSESIASSINQVSLLPKLNHLSNDSNLYYAIENYRLLFNDDSTADYSDSLKVRLFFENSTLADFNIRFRIFSKSNDDDYVKMISEKLVQISDDSKIFFNHDDRFELVKKLPIDFRENNTMLAFVSKIFENDNGEKFSKWNEYLNNFHINLFWLDVQQRFQSHSFQLMMTNEDQIDQTKILILIKKFLSTIFKRLNHLINKCRPNVDEILTIRETLIIFYQIFIQNQQSEKFIYEKFFPIWFLLNEKQIIFNNFIDLCNDSTVNEINQYFNISLFNEEKFKFVSKMCNNCFRFKSLEDLQAYREFQKYLKILQHNPQQQQIPEKVTDSVALLDDYFNEKISYESFIEKLSIQQTNDMNHESNKTATLVNKQCLTLTKLFSSQRYLDFYMNNESINSDDQYSNNDPYEIFFNHFIRNGHKYTDLFVEILFNINRELNLSSIIQSLCANNINNIENEANKFIISDKIKQNLTCEHIPLISIIYSQQMNNDNDSIEQFYKKKFTRKFFINFIYKNYFQIKTNQHQLFNRFVCLAEMFDEYIRQHSIVMADFIQNEKMKITTNPSELVECYRLILIGFTIANHTDPDYPIDPIIRLQTKLNDYLQQSAIIDEELKLRHLIYKQIYCEHNDESFNCLIFQKLQTKLNEFENQIEQLQKSIHYRQSFERYFKLIDELKQFKQTIFNWKNLFQIIKESQDCFTDPNQQTIAKCLMYCQTINDFLKYLHENYQDYHDLIIPFETGILLVIKGLQSLIYRLQSRLNTKFLFHSFQSSIIRMLFDRFSKFVTTALPSELCSFIFQNNIIQILHKIYQDLNLKTNLLFQNLFQSISLDIQNSLYLREDNRLEILAIFFQIIDSFVNQFQKIEMKQDLDEIRKNALFHIRLDDYDNDNNQENIEAKVEELFPSFENHFDRFLDPFEKRIESSRISSSSDDLNQNTLLFIARSHMQMIGLMEQQPTTTITNQMFDFVQSYLIRYKIIASILQKTMGFFDNNENIEQNLLDGHLLLMMKNSNSKNDSTLKTLNIYQSGIESQTEKCFSVLDNLRLKIEKDLLPEFENHPVLLKLLEIIKHVYEIKANSSLMCLATGLELILKTSEDWQLIAHRGISLVEYLNQITEILVEWRKMEINYWLKCLDMVSEKINEKELSIWWFRFYTIINDFLQTKQSDFENFKQFIDTVKKFIENSSLGQYEIRLKIIKVFIYYLKHSNLNTTIWIALENVYNFYNHFSLTIFKQISQEKAKIEKEIQEFVTISKWNPNNFWSLKASLSRSKKQLYGYVRKYEEYLSHPASKLFYFEKKLSSIQRFKSLKIDLVKMIESDSFAEVNFVENHCQEFPFISKSKSYHKKLLVINRKIRVKSKDFFETINDLEYFNIELIDSIDQYSNLKPTETKDLIIRKKQIAQIQNQKRRALSDLFRKLYKFGCRFRKGIFQFENGFNLNDTIFSEKSLHLNAESISFLSSNIESCNDYYYKSLSGYTMIVSLLEKPNQQLTLDMIDRIKGNIIHLTEIVDKQRKFIGKRMEQFNELNQKLMRLQKSYDPTEEDRIIADNLKPVLEMLHKFKNFILKFQTFTIRLNEILLSFEMNDEKNNFEEINLIIENVQQILIQIEPLLDVIIFTESRLTIVESSVLSMQQQIENLSKFLKEKYSNFMKLYTNEFQFFENEIENFGKFFNEIRRKNSNTLLDSDKSSLAECNVLLKNILFCFEKIFKYLDNDDTAKTEEDKEKFIKHSMNNVRILNLFNSEQIIQLVDKFFSNNFNQISIEIIKIFVPFFTKYMDLYKGFLCMSIGSLKTSSKLLHILMSLSGELLANGFCLPSCDDDNGNDEQQQQQKDQQKNIDNAGFGDGNITSDAKDVSDRLDCQDQLDDLENNNDDGGDGEDQQTDSKNEDNGIEMDDDFVGNEYGADEKQNDEKSDENDENDENDEDLEEQMGQVDSDEQVLDEKLWDNDDDDVDEKDQQKDGQDNEEQMTGGKEDFDTNKVANSDNDQLTSQNNNEEEDSQLPEDNDDINDQDKQINDDYQNIDDNDSKQNQNEKENINEMVLPDDVQIDMDDDGDGDQEMDIENENMEISDQDDDQNADQDDQNLETLNDENENTIEEPSNDDGDEDIDGMKNKNNQIEDGDDNDDENTITGSNTENQNIDSSIYPNFDQNVQNNQDCFDSMEQSDEKSSKQQQKQTSSSSQLNDGKLTSQNEQRQQQINDDEEKFSMLKKKKNRSLFDENLNEHLQTKRQKITNDSKKEDDDDSKEEANRQEQTDLFRHVENKKKADNIAYDIDYGQQQQEDGRKNQKPLERNVNLNDDDDDQQNNMESNEEIVKFSNNNSNSNNKNDLNKTNEEMNDKNEEKMIEGEFIMTSNVVNYQEESSFHTGTTAIEDQNQKMEIEDEHSMVPIDDTTTTSSSSEMLDNEFLLESEKRIEPLLYELCNQLQLVLEPTKRSKYKGDFKNGKRLNMRKVIAYVASQFRKDKIWLRRIKPNKRQYQILIAIDDSLSMSDNQSRMLAFDSLILLGKSLSIIESGLLSVVSFGEETRIVHSFGDPFTDQTINKIYNKLRFDQTQTKTNELLKCTASMFLQAKHLLSNSTSNIHQLLLIVSDGRGIFSEGESNIRSSIMRLKEIGVFTVFIIIDNPVNKNSILDIQIPVFDTDGTMKIQSYISKFPFSYYVILKDIHSLPMILGESLRQWLELIAYNG